MSKKHFIALADLIKRHNLDVKCGYSQSAFDGEHISALADFCAWQNHRFNRQRWLDYIAGERGPCGGAVK